MLKIKKIYPAHVSKHNSNREQVIFFIDFKWRNVSLSWNQYQKLGEAPFVICADHECFIEKTDGYKNHFESLFTAKVGKHIPSAFSMSLISLFKNRK